jgi:hypothetical protein
VSMESLVLESLISQVEDRAVAEVEAKQGRAALHQANHECFLLQGKLDEVGAKLTELEAALVETRANSAAAYRATALAEAALSNLCGALDRLFIANSQGKRTAIMDARSNVQKAHFEANKIIEVPF